MHDLRGANMDGLEDISLKEMQDIVSYARSIANMMEVAIESKQMPTGSVYWRAAKILSIVDNYLSQHEDEEHAAFTRETHGVLTDTELLRVLSEGRND